LRPKADIADDVGERGRGTVIPRMLSTDLNVGRFCGASEILDWVMADEDRAEPLIAAKSALGLAHK
jgi:hypothetical protein